MSKPRPLRPGDRIAIVAPASNCSRDEFDRGVGELHRLGFEPVFEPSVFERRTFTAGCARTRAAAFLKAWSDPSVAALIALRGGYGSVELLPLIEQMSLHPPKLFIGYSDNTSLLTWLTVHRGIPALHGPMIDGRLARGPDAYDERSFRELLAGGRGLSLEPDAVRVIKEGEDAGVLMGGTITQLTASLGTFWQQSSYQAGDVQTSLPAVTVLKPLVAMALGLTIYDETLKIGGVGDLLLLASIGTMVWATLVLGRLAAPELADPPPRPSAAS